MSQHHQTGQGIALIALGIICSHAAAQPAIGIADLPQGGETYIRANAVPPLFSDLLEDGGENLTWDFTALISTGDQETEYFPMGSASITTQFVFSSADHFTAFELPDLGTENPLPISGATTYLEFGSSAYTVVGLGITTDIFDLPVIYEDEEELLPLPLVYGASLEGTSAFEVDLPELLYYGTEQVTDIEVDAWGTVLLPGGSYDCLRVKRTFSAQDSVNIPAAEIGFSLPREGTVYEWYAPGEGMPVLSVQSIIGIPAVWQFKPDGTPFGLNEPRIIPAQVFPNPVPSGRDALLAFSGQGVVMVKVLDASGRTVMESAIESEHDQLTLPCASWPAGTYTAVIAGMPPIRFILR